MEDSTQRHVAAGGIVLAVFFGGATVSGWINPLVGYRMMGLSGLLLIIYVVGWIVGIVRRRRAESNTPTAAIRTPAAAGYLQNAQEDHDGKPISLVWAKDQWSGRHLGIRAHALGKPIAIRGIQCSGLDFWDGARRVSGPGDIAWLFLPTTVQPEAFASDEDSLRILATSGGDREYFFIKDHENPSRQHNKRKHPGLWMVTLRVMLEDSEYDEAMCFKWDPESPLPLSPAVAPG